MSLVLGLTFRKLRFQMITNNYFEPPAIGQAVPAQKQRFPLKKRMSQPSLVCSPWGKHHMNPTIPATECGT
jgi:hypothetical protein